MTPVLRLLISLFLGVIFIIPGQAVSNGQWNTLKAGIREIELAPSKFALSQSQSPAPAAFGVDAAPVVSVKTLEEINTLIQENGSFKGVDYKNKNKSVWPTLVHLDYCRSLAIGLNLFPESVLKKHNVRANCLSSLDWWLEHTPRNPNWWQNDIYVTQMLGNIALLLPDKDLTKDRLAALSGILKKTKPSQTGQNLMWLSWSSLLASIMEKDAKRFEEAVNAMHKAISIAAPGKEGIQPDFSFHQHGSQLYQGNYGRHYLHSAAKFARLLNKTPWADSQKNTLIESLLLDGTRWMCSGQLLDYNVWGRQITYNDRIQGPDLLYACINLANVKTKRNKEILLFARTLSSSDRPCALKENSVTGSKAFPYSDYIVHRDNGLRYMTGIRMSSNRTILGEQCNGDNLKGCYLADGCMLTYVTGEEYSDIFPVWDWTCIPGTTTERNNLPIWQKWSNKKGSTPFAGCMDEGLAAIHLNRFELSARKSWFFLNGKIVCMGSAISKENSQPIVTTVEQSLLKGKVTKEESERTLSFKHSDSLYVFPKQTPVLLETDKRTGSWSDIRSGHIGEDKVEKEVFLLAIDHGASPYYATYIYQVIPSHKDASPTPDEHWAEVKVLKHDENVHAISYNGNHYYVFFSNGEAPLPDGKIVSVPEPCLLFISSSGTIKASIPGKRIGSIDVLLGTKKFSVSLSSSSE